MGNFMTERLVGALKDIKSGVLADNIIYFIPRKRFCRMHVSPFAFVCDMFFENVRNSIAFASRTGGKTLNISILNHLDMAFKPQCEITSAGSTITQAGKMYQYFTQFHSQNHYLNDLLFKDPTKSKSV